MLTLPVPTKNSIRASFWQFAAQYCADRVIGRHRSPQAFTDQALDIMPGLPEAGQAAVPNKGALSLPHRKIL
jgi:hypothetical protein